MPGLESLVCEDFRILSDEPGLDLFVRNKHPQGMSAFRKERTILLVHGATYPASTSFDLELDGYSWMDFIASRGFDVYALDLRGYGRSTRPPEMDQPADRNRPLVRGDVALRDIAAAVHFIKERRALGQLVMLGWSWGTQLAGAYASRSPEDVNRLVLYAPLWLREHGDKTANQASILRLPAYRTVTQIEARARWLTGVPEEAKSTLLPRGWFEKWAEATWATDPLSRSVDPPALRAPNGVIADVIEFNNSGRPYYEPSHIKAPTLLASPEWDNDTPPSMALTLYEQLTGASERKLVSIPRGTHSVALEQNRDALFSVVQEFLEAG